MGHKYAGIAFTDTVKDLQTALGSRRGYAKRDVGPDTNDRLGPQEAAFIAARDSFYMATVSETGWPYMQHRGGPAGFVRVLDDKTLGFADFAGNRQYVSIGNLKTDDRVSLFFMDYANRARLKMFGRARVLGPDDAETLQRLATPSYSARVERGVAITVEAFDWNCPQHITPRFSAAEIDTTVVQLAARVKELEAALSSVQA